MPTCLLSTLPLKIVEKCLILALREAADAQRVSEAGRVRGKLVLIVDEPLAGQRPRSAEPL